VTGCFPVRLATGWGVWKGGPGALKAERARWEASPPDPARAGICGPGSRWGIRGPSDSILQDRSSARPCLDSGGRLCEAGATTLIWVFRAFGFDERYSGIV
jgi:hypothetical protein